MPTNKSPALAGVLAGLNLYVAPSRLTVVRFPQGREKPGRGTNCDRKTPGRFMPAFSDANNRLTDIIEAILTR